MRASGFPTSTRTIQSVLAGFLSALVLLPGQTAPGAGTLQVQDTWQVIELPVKIVSGEGAKKHLPATMGAGIAIADFDGDGRPDLFFANGGELPSAKKTERTHANRLLRNLGDLRFEDVTYEAGLAGTHFAIAAAAGDFY